MTPPDPDYTGQKPEDDPIMARLDALLDARPEPPRIPDVQRIVLARIRQSAQRKPWLARLLARPLYNSTAWGMAGALAGLLFLLFIQPNPPPAPGVEWEVEVAEASLMPGDVAVIFQLGDTAMPEDQP